MFNSGKLCFSMHDNPLAYLVIDYYEQRQISKLSRYTCNRLPTWAIDYFSEDINFYSLSKTVIDYRLRQSITKRLKHFQQLKRHLSCPF